MEKEIFDWEDCNQMDTAAFRFTNCVLKKDVGNFKAGTKIDTIDLDFQSGMMEFYCGEKCLSRFEMEMVVKRELLVDGE